MMKKKGLSSIIATLLLILFSVLAIVIISAFIIPFIKNNLEEGSECLDYKDYFTFDDSFDFNCYAQSGENFETKFSLLGDSVNEEIQNKVIGFKVVFKDVGSSDVEDVYGGDAPGYGDPPHIKMFNDAEIMSIPKSGEVQSYTFVSTRSYREISVAPMLDNGRLCDVSDTLRIDGRIC